MILVPHPRKTFLHLNCFGNHLQGIGGPGAPHTFRFDRASDLGSVRFESLVELLFAKFPGIFYGIKRTSQPDNFEPDLESHLAGIDRSKVDSAFWRRIIGNVEHASDVILRTGFILQVALIHMKRIAWEYGNFQIFLAGPSSTCQIPSIKRRSCFSCPEALPKPFSTVAPSLKAGLSLQF